MIRAAKSSHACALVFAAALVVLHACGTTSGSGFHGQPGGGSSSGSGGSGSGASGSGGSGGSSGASGSGGSLFGDAGFPDATVPDGSTPPLVCPMPTTHNDFAAPVIDTGAPANAPTLFAAADVGTDGPCMYEPEPGSLFPENWIRLRFRFTTVHQENLFEIKLVVPNETSPLLIYTTQNPYTMHTLAWQAITTIGVNGPIQVSVRSATFANGALTGGPWSGSSGTIQIAPVPATGTVVYWTTSNGTVLKGFQMGFPVGEAPPQPILTPTQEGNGSGCIGCHASTPDGLYAGLTTSTDPSNGTGNASIDLRSVDGMFMRPSFLTTNAIALLGRLNQHAPSFSRAHWTSGDHTMLSMINPGGSAAGPTGTTEITWTDLEAKGQAQGTDWGVIARNGDNLNAASAQFSHDGKTIVYTSVTTADAAMNSPDGLIYTVPYNARMGGNAAAVAGASDSSWVQYYPMFSTDDAYLVFNRVPSGSTGGGGPATYNNPSAELFVVPSAGGNAVRLAANDPPACLGAKSPGVTNSWGKWSPQALSNCGSTYYFLVFSSTRDPGAAGGQQLYVAPIVVDGKGTVTTYSALYLWNQPETEHNHTPAWDVFEIPPPPPQPPPPQ
jgi:hypothetical protein